MDESTVAARLLSLRGTELLLEFQSARMQACVRRQGNDFEVAIEGRSWRLHRLDPLARRAGAEDDPARLVAPVHGRVLDVPVSPGSSVKRGQVLMLLECMKLEYRVTAPADGLVEALHYAVGDVVEEGALLLTFVPSAGSG